MSGRVLREALNGGVVQVRHPQLLQPGEVQTASDCILRPGDPALHRAPGRAAYGTVISSSISCHTSSNTTLDTGTFGLAVTLVTVSAGDTVIAKTSAFGTTVSGGDSDTIKRGQSVYGTGIPAGAVVVRVVDTGHIEMSVIASASGTVTVVFSDLHPSTFISGSGIPLYTQVSAVTSATTLTMTLPATNTATANRLFSEQIQGIRALSFDHDFNDILLAKAADKVYYSSLTATTGTFTELAHGLSQNADAILEAIQFKNRHIYLTGYDPPRTLYWKDSGSGNVVQERALGMQPVRDFVGPALTSGSWSSLTELQNGWYYFIVTEVAIFGPDDEVESTYTGKPKGVQITAYATQAIKVTYNPVSGQAENDGNYGRNTATHWRIYMAKSSEQFPVPDLAAFTQVGGDVPLATQTVTLADTNPFQTGYSAVLASFSTDDPLFPSGSTAALSQTAAQSKSCAWSGGSNVLTAAAFGTVAAGMFINDSLNRIPYGTTVIAILPGATSLLMSNVATTSSSGSETVWFGNNKTFDFVNALCPVNNGATRRGGVFQNFGVQNIGAFSSATITGIKVEIMGHFFSAGHDTGFIIELNKGGSGGSYSTTGRSFVLSKGLATLGDQQDLWGLTWAPADFVDGSTKFGVRIRKVFGGSGTNWNHLIDGVRVTIYGGGNTINLNGTPFRTIIISDQLNQTFGTGARGPAPVASTGDVFDGMLLLNDLSDESVLCASLPDEHESFPDVYRIPIEPKAKLRVIRKVQNIVVLGCVNSIKRLNYFPRETDPDFTRGRCYEDIASDHGMVAPRAAKMIDLAGAGSVLAYLSHDGLRFTDGVHTHFLNSDIDWQSLIEPTLIQRSVLEVYPRLSLLALYYVPPGQTRKIDVLYFSYHPTHVKPGLRLPAVGPVTCESGSAASTLLSGQTYLLTGHSMDGKVYLEDQGTSDGSGGVIEPHITTRRFAATPGHSMRTERIFLLTDADGTTTTGGFTASIYRQNENEALTLAQSDVTKDTSVGGLITLWMDNEAETFEVRVAKSESGGQNADMRIHYLGLEFTTDTTDTNN